MPPPGLHVSICRYAARRQRDPGTFSRYLNGTRLPPWQVITDLFADLPEHRGTAVTTEAIEFVRELYGSAVDAASSPDTRWNSSNSNWPPPTMSPGVPASAVMSWATRCWTGRSVSPICPRPGAGGVRKADGNAAP
jgi:hypothetical protein